MKVDRVEASSDCTGVSKSPLYFCSIIENIDWLERYLSEWQSVTAKLLTRRRSRTEPKLDRFSTWLIEQVRKVLSESRILQTWAGSLEK